VLSDASIVISADPEAGRAYPRGRPPSKVPSEQFRLFGPFQLGYADLAVPGAMLPAGKFVCLVRSMDRIGIRATAVRLCFFTTARECGADHKLRWAHMAWRSEFGKVALVSEEGKR